ncbi:DUF4870 family protein [Marinospirillum perlucidum]|uniref:DUF4870 family protein n=1 Tax=Marinospirillum perlucidum TaxID=1982602 RepID=UPI001C498B22|nr:hypothetical protein [Marinospirillum perlucidum]
MQNEPHSPSKTTDELPTSGGYSMKTITLAVYALQAASFLVGFTFVVAVIINYVKASEVRGTWLETHFRWQIRTFWFSLLWVLVGIVLSFVLIGYLVFLVNTIWVIYRIVKGWLRLTENKPMYVEF